MGAIPGYTAMLYSRHHSLFPNEGCAVRAQWGPQGLGFYVHCMGAGAFSLWGLHLAAQPCCTLGIVPFSLKKAMLWKPCCLPPAELKNFGFGLWPWHFCLPFCLPSVSGVSGLPVTWKFWASCCEQVYAAPMTRVKFWVGLETPVGRCAGLGLSWWGWSQVMGMQGAESNFLSLRGGLWPQNSWLSVSLSPLVLRRVPRGWDFSSASAAGGGWCFPRCWKWQLVICVLIARDDYHVL